MEHLLHVRLQHQHRRSLRHPTDHVGYAQNPGPALLGDFHRSDRAGKIATRHHAIPQPVEVVLQPRFELLDRHTVGPGRSAIALHLQPRIPDQPLGDVVRLALQPRLTHAIPPFRLISLVRQDDPAPSLPNPLRYAGGSQLLRTSPPASPHRYSAPHGFRRLEFSLSPPARVPAKSRSVPNVRTCLPLELDSRPGPTRSRGAGPRRGVIRQIGRFATLPRPWARTEPDGGTCDQQPKVRML